MESNPCYLNSALLWLNVFTRTTGNEAHPHRHDGSGYQSLEKRNIVPWAFQPCSPGRNRRWEKWPWNQNGRHASSQTATDFAQVGHVRMPSKRSSTACDTNRNLCSMPTYRDVSITSTIQPCLPSSTPTLP